MSAPKSTNKRNLFLYMLNELGERIVSGYYKPGTRFPNEMQICEEFSASRPVVREAIKALAAKGIIESRTKTGIHILPPERWNYFDIDTLRWRAKCTAPRLFMHEIYEVRRALEPQAAALAAVRASDKEIAELEDLLRKTEEAHNKAPGGEDYKEFDRQFHKKIYKMSGNFVLLSLGHLWTVGIESLFNLYPDFPPYFDLHHTITKAIRDKNPEGAKAAVLKLVQACDDHLKTNLA